jgi:hypothetical protein
MINKKYKRIIDALIVKLKKQSLINELLATRDNKRKLQNTIQEFQVM